MFTHIYMYVVYIYMYVVCEYLYVHKSTARTPSWHQRVLSSLIFYVSFAKKPYKNEAPFRKRPRKSRSLQILATSTNTLLAIRGCRPAISLGLICKRALPKWGSFAQET